MWMSERKERKKERQMIWTCKWIETVNSGDDCDKNGSFLYTCRCFVLFFLTLSLSSFKPFFLFLFQTFLSFSIPFLPLTTCVIFLRQMIGSHIGFRKWMFCREEVKRRDSFLFLLFLASVSKCIALFRSSVRDGMRRWEKGLRWCS